MQLKLSIRCLALCSLIACRPLDATIEFRQNKAYLVNQSTTKSFNFTVRTTEIINDSIYNYKTEIIHLSAGDEKLLGFTSTTSPISYPTISKEVFHTYNYDYSKFTRKGNKKVLTDEESIGQFFKDQQNEDSAIAHAGDTIITGIKLKYRYTYIYYDDSLHPYPQNRVKYLFEVKGQTLVKE